MRARRGALSLIAAVVLLAAPAAAADAAPAASILQATSRLEGALRFAVERQPEGLLESLTAAERVCDLGARAEGMGETELAAADWSSLEQVVTLLAEPELRGVRRALRHARRELARLERRFRRAWDGQQARLRLLAGATRPVRNGIDQMIASLATLESAFAAWRQHRCEAALAATATSTRQARAGIDGIAIGMQRLWLLGSSPRRQ